MKTIKLLCILVFLMLISSTLFAQTQMKYWALPPYKIDFTGSSPTTSLLPAYNNLAQFYGLTGLAFDDTGNLIVADYQNNAIRKISPTGVVSTIAGNGTAGHTDATGLNASFSLPASVVLDVAQNIYVADLANNRIRKITPLGVVTTFAGTGQSGKLDGPGTTATFKSPYGLAIDASGNLYVADSDNNAIRKITPSGVVSTVAGGNVTPDYLDGTGSVAKFSSPKNITRDVSGNFYITDCNNNRIRKMTPAGDVTTVAGTGAFGTINGAGNVATFSRPYGIVVDASSNLYVTELLTGTIRKITSAGVVSTYAGTGVPGFADGPAATAQFQWPTGLALDASGNLYEADNETHRVRKITPSGIVSTYAGTGAVGLVDTPADDYSASNGAFDENGNVLFTIKDSIITDKLGVAIGKLNSYSQFISGTGYEYYTTTGKEISIVPVPGTCRDFYIIYTKYGATQWYEGVKLLYTKVTVSAAGIVTIVPNFNGILVGSVGGSFMSIALSTSSSSNTRFIYALGKYSLTKYTISSSGISAGSGYPGISTNYAKVLELNFNGDKLSWIESTGTNTAIIHIYNLSSFTDVKLSISSIVGGEYFGLEFSPDNNSLYFSASSSTAALGGIYKVSTLTTAGPVTPTQIISGHYTNTELELGRDGFMYGIDGLASDDWYTKTTGVLGKINLSTNLYSPLSNILISSAKTNGPWNKIYMLPDQIDGENYGYFFGTPQLTSVTTINGSAINPTVPLNTYTCGAISLTNTASAATSYQITITKTDASGNVLTGTQAYSYSPGLLMTAPPATIDLKALNTNYLANSINIGYYKITFLTQNACTSNTVFGLIYNSTMSLASANFTVNDGSGTAIPPNSTLPGTTVSAYGVAVNGSSSTGYVNTYQIKVDQVDRYTGAILVANVVNTPATNVTNGDPSTLTGVNLNTKSAGYFLSHAGYFKITYTVTNICGSSSQTGYFNEDIANGRIGNIDIAQTDKVYPNPSNGAATVAFTMEEDNTVSLVLNNIQGGASYTVFTDKSASQGNNEITFDTSTIPAGLYVYQLSDGTDTFQTGKFVIVK